MLYEAFSCASVDCLCYWRSPGPLLLSSLHKQRWSRFESGNISIFYSKIPKINLEGGGTRSASMPQVKLSPSCAKLVLHSDKRVAQRAEIDNKKETCLSSSPGIYFIFFFCWGGGVIFPSENEKSICQSISICSCFSLLPDPPSRKNNNLSN